MPRSESSPFLYDRSKCNDPTPSTRGSRAAKLGIPRQTLEWKIGNLNIDKLTFRRPTVT